MDALSLFGLAAVTAMLVCYAVEKRARGWTLGFACAAGSAYGFIQDADPSRHLAVRRRRGDRVARGAAALAAADVSAFAPGAGCG